MDTQLVVVSLWGEDVGAMIDFYQDVIGLRIREHHHDPPHFDLGGSSLVILKGTPQKPLNPKPERFPILAIAVDDLDQMIDRLRENDIELPWDIQKGPGSRYVMFHDPGENLVELVEFV